MEDGADFEDSSVIRRLVLDVLKPHNPDIISFSRRLSDLPGVDGVNIMVYEMDRQVENVKVTLEGAFIDPDAIRAVIAEVGASLHSIDEVAVGRRLVEAEETLQDRK